MPIEHVLAVVPVSDSSGRRVVLNLAVSARSDPDGNAITLIGNFRVTY